MTFSSRFLLDHSNLEWADLLWGYSHGLIGWRVPVEFADAKVTAGNWHDELTVDLAVLGKDQDWMVRDILEELSIRQPVPPETSQKKWLFLTLLQNYETRDAPDEAFEQVEQVYADFGYPEEIRSFVRFMPSVGSYEPAKHTKEENYARMLSKWKDYLDETRLSLGW